MFAAGLHGIAGTLCSIRQIVALFAPRIAWLAFHQILKQANDTFDRLGARADGVNELDAEFAEALADFDKRKRVLPSGDERGALPDAAFKVERARQAPLLEDAGAKAADDERVVVGIRLQRPAENTQRTEIDQDQALATHQLETALAVRDIEDHRKSHVIGHHALQAMDAAIVTGE